VRISGKKALLIADRIFISKADKKPSAFKTYTTHYGWIAEGKKVIDEVILTVMRSPRSYTKEDVVEINCPRRHSCFAPGVGFSLGRTGAGWQSRGDLPTRFFNGRIDLAQASRSWISSGRRTDSALRMSVEHYAQPLLSDK